MSSIAGITPTTDPYQATNLNAFVQFVNDFNAIGNALQTGNLSGAQSALSDFQQDLPDASKGASQQPFGSNHQANTDYTTLANALQNGDLPGAQQAYSSLQTNLESGAKTRRQRYRPSSGASSGAQTSEAFTPAQDDSLLDVTA